MYFRQLLHEATGCIAYAAGCLSTRTVAIIDPQEDVSPYLEAAEAKGLRVTHVIDTHTHADHVSGARALAETSGADLSLHEASAATYGHAPLREGQTIKVGNAHLTVLHAPGHTEDSIALVVADNARSVAPAFVLTGDTLMIGDVGRPDLTGEGGAAALYDTLFGKLLTLPDDLEIFPAHFAGSACGRGLSPKPSSTIGYERRVNPLLRPAPREEFVRLVMEDLPPKPARFEEIVARNLGRVA